MKRNLVFALAFGAVSMSARAENEANVLENPGFEEATLVDADKKYDVLIERGVEMPRGDSVPMPLGWTLNEVDGWAAGKGCIFQYVEGKPGKEVFKGERAVYFASKDRATIFGKPAPVAAAPDPDHATLQLHKPNRFSFYAKGSGKLSVRVYTYGDKVPPQYGDFTVTPAVFDLTDEWQKYEGSIEFTYAGVRSCAFALSVMGEATVDELEMVGN